MRCEFIASYFKRISSPQRYTHRIRPCHFFYTGTGRKHFFSEAEAQKLRKERFAADYWLPQNYPVNFFFRTFGEVQCEQRPETQTPQADWRRNMIFRPRYRDGQILLAIRQTLSRQKPLPATRPSAGIYSSHLRKDEHK